MFTGKIPRQNPHEQRTLKNEGQECKIGHVKGRTPVGRGG
jgi:hypothetical protein